MTRQMTVLIIDDELLVRRNLRLFLEDGGFQVIEAADGRTGIGLLTREVPDLVLTDLTMPGMDGFKVIELLKVEHPETPVIVVSATSDVQHALEALRSGAWDYIVKPIQDAGAFNVVIQRTLERRRLLAENKRYQDSLEEMVKERTRDLLILSQVVAQSPFGIVITDLSGNIEYVNPQFTQITGYALFEVLQQNPRLLKSELTPPELHRELWETISRGEVWEGHFHNRRKDGGIYPEHSTISAIRDSDGCISHFMAIKEDITEMLNLAEEAKRAQAKLIQTDKLASLGLLVSSIAHEINNPNNFIMRNSELLTGAWQAALPILDEYFRENGDYYLGDFLFSETREILPRLFSGLKDGSRRIRNIVDRLKNYARQDSDNRSQGVDVNAVILEAVSILNHEIKKLCDGFQVSAAPDLPPITGKAQQIEQVIINLVINALQALPDRTRSIRITTVLAEDREHVMVTIADEGAGMPPEVLKNLTEPFFTTKADSGGTGLGLYISKEILRENEGSLAIASEPGVGTTATVLLKIFKSSLEGVSHAPAGYQAPADNIVG